MIKRISEIKNIRNLINFDNDQDFSMKRNIIYAPNGVGKTNFSRSIHSLTLQDEEKEKYLQDLKSMEIEGDPNKNVSIELSDFNNIKHTESECFGDILVFNSDYVDKNIRTGTFMKEVDGDLEILLGSEENEILELEKDRNLKEGKKIELIENIVNILELEKEKIKDWDKGAKKDGRHMRLLTYENLSKEKIEQYNVESSFDELKKSFESIGDLDPEKDKIIDNNRKVDNNLDIQWIKDILLEVVFFKSEAEGELKEHISKLTDDWIREGLHFHKNIDDKHCPFCKLELDDKAKEVIDKYKIHIKSEKAEFNKKINGQIKDIERLCNDVSRINNDNKESFDKRSDDLGISDKWVLIDTKDILKKLEDLKVFLQNKTEDNGLIVTNIKEYLDSLNENMAEINSRIETNKNLIIKANEKLNSISARQSNLRESIAKSILIEVFNQNKTNLEDIDALKKDIDDLNKDIQSKRSNLPELKAIENVKRVFNYILREKVGIKKYVADIEDKFIYLKLYGYNISKHTKKISEGEKTAIAFCYFIASSIQNRKNIEDFTNTVFVIDDPICSIGYGYFYGIGDIVKNFPKYIKENVWPNLSEPQGSPQIILLTHNIQFFNLLSSQIFRNDFNKHKDELNKISIFELENNGSKHYLRPMKKEETLSEFHTALRRVKGFSEGKNIENIGNDIRRILETLCSFKGKTLTQENVEAFFKGSVVEPKLLSFANDKSHNNWNDHEDPNKDNYDEASKGIIDLLRLEFEDVLSSLPPYREF